jgi:hypothetical protein
MDKIKFLISFDSFITYIDRYTNDWLSFKKANLSKYVNHYKAHLETLESYTESKYDNGFFTWFLELFLKFVQFKALDPFSDCDILVLKVESIVNYIISPDAKFDSTLGTLDKKTIDTFKEALNQFKNRAGINLNSNSNSIHKKKNKLEDIQPENFNNLTQCREFIAFLMNKLARYQNHVDIFKLHLAKDEPSTPSSLFFCNFPAPFLSDDEEFVKAYNILIADFQTKTMDLIMSRLNYFIELLKSKINSIKNNLSKNIQIQPTIDEVFDNLDKSVKSGLENKFKAAISKVDRCKPRPYIAGVRFKTRKPKVRINNSFVSTPQPSQPVSPAPLSLNSSVSSIASSNQNQHKSILRSNPGSINQNHSESLQINQSAPSSSSTSSFNNNRVHSSSSSGQNIQQLSSSTQSHSSNSQSRFKNTFFNKNSAFDPYKTA